MKSILHLRIDSPGYDSNAIEQAWREAGYEYFSMEWQSIRFNDGIESLRSQAIELARQLKPTLIFAHIQLPEIFDLETFKELQKHGDVINFTFDVRVFEKTKWMYEAAPHIRHTFFACDEDVVYCKSKKIINVSCVMSSCDMELYKPKKVASYAFDVVFVGNKYVGSNLDFPLAQERQDMIAFLEKHYGPRFRAFGLGQEGGMIKQEAEANVYQYSKIAISQNNFERRQYTSDRIWKIMASETFCLSRFFPGMENIFKKEIDLDWWENLDELKDLLDFYLAHDQERETVAQTGSQLVRSSHRWQDRVAQIEKVLEV